MITTNTPLKGALRHFCRNTIITAHLPFVNTYIQIARVKMGICINDEILKEELTSEQYEEYERNKKELGIDYAIGNLPDMGNSIISTMANRNIKQLRIENGLSQTDLANVLKVSQKEYWRYEQDGYSINILKLANIAIFYNVSLDWISGYHKTRKPFFENDSEDNITCVNGYVLSELKEAKAKGEKYEAHILH